MDTELNTTMVPPFNLGSGLGSSPNPVPLSQNTFPPLSQSATNKKRQRPDSDDETNTFSFFKPVENFPKFIVKNQKIKKNQLQHYLLLSLKNK